MRQRLLLVIVFAVLALGSLPARAVPASPAAPGPIRPLDELTVSLEWQPGNDERFGGAGGELASSNCADVEGNATYLKDLDSGLREMAAYIYSYTGGQIKLHTITIYTGGTQWDNADIRILANRSYRPTAFIGGNALAPEPFYGSSPTPRVFFAPAPIVLGRLWDGGSARCGAWSEPAGWRTLGHEWAHYALRLYDEYMHQGSAAEQFCTNDETAFARSRAAGSARTVGGTLQSLMAYHYTADQLSRWEASSIPPPCRDTPQATVYGESNWATVQRFFPDLRPPTDPSSVPAYDKSALDIAVVDSGGLANTSATIALGHITDSEMRGPTYLIRPDPKQDGAPAQIVGQGTVVSADALPMRFWGVQTLSGDRATTLIQNPVSGATLAFPEDYHDPAVATALSTDLANVLSVEQAGWQPSLTITPQLTVTQGQQLGDVTGLVVRLNECGAKQLSEVEMAYCPAGGGCTPLAPATQTADGAWEHTFTFPLGKPPAVYGYMYVREPLRGAEAVTWYQIAGGVGPAHSGGHAPTAEGLVNVDLPQNVPNAPNTDNRMLYSPALVCPAQQPLPPGITRIVDVPIRVGVTIGDSSGGQPWITPMLRVRVNYDQDLLDRLGLDESRLQILQLDKTGQWRQLPTLGRSTVLNWIAAPLQTGDDGTATLALGYGPVRVLVPLVVR